MALLRVAGTIEESITDGPGIRFVVFAQGCRHRCPGCHNPQTHDFEGGEVVSVEEILARMQQNPLLDGLTLSGGDPFEQAEGFAVLAERAKALGYPVMTYTGYTFEALTAGRETRPGWEALLRSSDILVDGPFLQAHRDHRLRFRGSANQRILNLRESLSLGRPAQVEL